MSDTGTTNPLLNEVVTFIQNDIPGFEAGTYKLQLTQTLVDGADGGGTINEDPIALDYKFAVSGDRFAFAQPDSAVFAVFPPDTASGAWDTVFPHAVFPLSNLPWIRSPTKAHPEPNAVGDIPTWLYVLLLDDDDAKAGNFSLDPATGVIGDLFPASFYSKSSLKSGVSYFSDGGDATALEPGQAMDSPIQYLDVPLSLFWQVAPTLADLALMAHVREVSFIQKPTISSVTDVGQPAGAFSIVFGNRLPQDGANTRCYLVSLEALEDYLPTSPDGGAPKAGQDGRQLLRLAVLRSWRFRSTGQPATFVDALLALNQDDAAPSGEKRTVLQLPYAGANAALQAGFEMGYVPLNTVMRTGEDTLSWYRGPLAPYANAVVPPALPVTSPDAALIFDPTTGMFDMSYGTAWTIGRMVALQDQSFSVPLYGWKQGVHQKLLASVSGGILAQRLAALSATPLPMHVAARVPELDTASFDSAHHLILHALAGRD
ncbi:MAG: hypothetical protein EOP58_01400 [Sphingomonadales bacterium]|nr:MAG: hypothetical protein EOP58_01400 [Sphingomonadales bacterium]